MKSLDQMHVKFGNNNNSGIITLSQVMYPILAITVPTDDQALSRAMNGVGQSEAQSSTS